MVAEAFLSYSHADEKALERLHKHLAVLKREGTLPTWSDHAILAGDRLDGVISAQLERSQIFLALVSPDYLASQYCYDKEFARALELAAAGRMRIVPVILEPCDWLSSPFKDFAALPKDGQPISGFTNPNNAYLNVVVGLRRLIEVPGNGTSAPADGIASPGQARRPRIKQDFDSIQRAEYADRAFTTIRDYFRASCAELAQIGDDLRSKFEDIDATAFTCSVVNRAKRQRGEAHITVHNCKSRNVGFGDISYVNQPHAERNTSNGSIRVTNDDYQLFLNMDHYGMSSGRDRERTTPEQAAETLWGEFVRQAGIEYD
ncbi:TIR protein [Methylocella tundrae]|uniref:TIR protein n=1 Tax=Methylocella tundrae TaxID=227605 RepID=A0A4U8Z7W2_METTU|nr:toll/interleukin-1 receptor domain-containing protein [Methylocella tundrae]WPP02645.1 toll/interleukin-1 receptor domain-containing protein [Methylocella tundrae]VFU17681.1 TIR protein [Methylocella tundrae]VTZ26899.1 TIR protein [Methylocella tundrae]VTZ48825.1 TIR protein [Methylocella tundrae]